jgi:DNA primase small subunit
LNAFVKSNKHAGQAKSAKILSSKDCARLESWPAEVVFQYTYPRLDVNVSKMRNHLLKSPFCVHPKTGRVCVPFLASQVDDFDPFGVPTLPQLMQELDAWNASENVETIKHDWQKTSLKPYFESFQAQFLDPLLQKIRKEERQAAEQQAALTGDF